MTSLVFYSLKYPFSIEDYNLKGKQMGPFTQLSPDAEKAVGQQKVEIQGEGIETVHEAAERGHVATDK